MILHVDSSHHNLKKQGNVGSGPGRGRTVKGCHIFWGASSTCFSERTHLQWGLLSRCTFIAVCFLNENIYLFNVYVSESMYVHHTHVAACGSWKKVMGPLEAELQEVVSSHVGSGN